MILSLAISLINGAKLLNNFFFDKLRKMDYDGWESLINLLLFLNFDI